MNRPRFVPYKSVDEVSIIANALDGSGLQRKRHNKFWLHKFKMISVI